MTLPAPAATRRIVRPGLQLPASSVALRLAVETLIGMAVVVAAALVRLLLEQVAGGLAPFVLTFPAVMAATLLRGTISGIVALVGCQLLTLHFVFPNWIFHRASSSGLVNLALSTVALSATLWATAAYRRASAQLQWQCRREVETLTLLIVEMDHRTKNNFQIAANLLAHQALSSADGQLAGELDKAALRLRAIASVYESLSTGHTDDERVDLAVHLARIVDLLREGAAPAAVTLVLEADHVEAKPETAIIIGLIVNEWVTNAVKYAFAAGPGRITVRVRRLGGGLTVEVEDDGAPVSGSAGEGRGSELMRSLAQVIGAELLVDRRNGTHCSLHVPPRIG